MATYNGHKSWAYWNVALWIGSDEGLYHLAKDCIRRTKNRTQAAEMMLSALQECGIEKTPDGANYTKTAIKAGMAGL